jgi:hypothetical protein
MASPVLRTGSAITVSPRSLFLLPLDALAGEGGGVASIYAFRSYSSRKAYRDPAAHGRGSTKCLTCD